MSDVQAVKQKKEQPLVIVMGQIERKLGTLNQTDKVAVLAFLNARHQGFIYSAAD